jgi:hypothetical protein
VADFQIPPQGTLRRVRARIIHWLMYRFFRITTKLSAKFLVPPAPFLGQAGCYRTCSEHFPQGSCPARVSGISSRKA